MKTDTASLEARYGERVGRDSQLLVAAQRKVAGAFALAVVLAIGIGLVSFWSVSRLGDDAAWVGHSRQVIGSLQELLSTLASTQSASRGYAITGSESFLRPYSQAVGSVRLELANLRELIADNPEQQARAQALSSLIDERMRISENIVAIRRERGTESAREFIANGRGEQVQDSIRHLISEMAAAEQALLSERQVRSMRSSAVAKWVSVTGSALAFAIVLGSYLLIRRDFSGARHSEAALREANLGLESRVAQRTGELTRANARLGSSYRELRLLVEQTPLSIAMLDRNMRYIAASRRWAGAYGKGRDELAGLSHYELHPDLPKRWIEVHRRGLAGEFHKHDEDLWVQADGSKHWLRWAVSPWRNEDGDIGGITMFAEDITERKLAEERLRLADAVFRSTQEGIVITDLRGHIVAVNPAFSIISEFSEAELLGQHMRLLQSGRQDESFYRNMWQHIAATGSWQGEIWDRRKSGEVHQQWLAVNTVRDEAGEPVYYVGVATDLSRMNHAESHLEYLAHHDALTGLPNRALLFSRLAHSIERARREGSPCAVVFLDLDGFKGVNDSLGHEAGDELLQLAANRMRQRLRDSDTLARFAGDEFVVVLEHISVPGYAAQITQALIEQLRTPFALRSGAEVGIGGSAGISLFPADGDDAESLIRCADAALYRAKAAGRGIWRFHDSQNESNLPGPR